VSDSASGTLSLTYTRTDSVDLPQSAAEKRFAIRMSDWERLKRQLETCRDDFGSNLSGWYFCSFGVAASSILSIIPLALSTGVPVWAVPVYILISIFGTVLGVVLMLVERRAVRDKKGRIAEIGIDMSEIERGFQSS